MSDDPQSGDGAADAGLPGGVPQDNSSDSSSSDSSSSDSSSLSTNGAGALDPTRWSNILMGAISTNTGLRTGNAVTYLIDGPATFAAMLTAISSTSGSGHYIYLLGWQLVDNVSLDPSSTPTGGATSNTFADLMTAASARGVQIRAMLWKQYKGLNQPEVDFINTLANGAAILDNATSDPVLGSHHQKVLVVKGSDGLIGFCGGIDINSDRVSWGSVTTSSGSASGSDSSGNPAAGSPDGGTAVDASSSSGTSGAPLHDVHCQVMGPSAWDLLLTFVRRWDHHPDHSAIDSSKGDLLGRTEAVPASASTPSSTGSSCSVAIGRTFTPATPGTSVPKERDVAGLLLAAIANAQRFIYMEDQYLISPEAAAALNARVPNLQHLTILIAASEISDLPCRWRYRQQFIDAVTNGLSAADAAKVRVFQLVTPPASTPPTFGAHTYVHSKTWVFDDELAVIGSANCNRRGWQSDSEADAFIFDDAPPAVGSLTFAQLLRCDLWSEHLGIPAGNLTDGVASVSNWVTSSPSSRVLPYDPAGDTNTALCDADSVRDAIDPPSP
jgi:phosphatidylserine/phosphatidylglycerophosphate/cardiolipin synthase-like enzyme